MALYKVPQKEFLRILNVFEGFGFGDKGFLRVVRLV